MKLVLTRGGGLAGLRKPPLELDTQALPAADAAHVQALVDAAGLGAQPRRLGADHPDQLGYTLEVTRDGRTDAIDFTLDAAPPPLRALVDALRKLTAAK